MTIHALIFGHYLEVNSETGMYRAHVECENPTILFHTEPRHTPAEVQQDVCAALDEITESIKRLGFADVRHYHLSNQSSTSVN